MEKKDREWAEEKIKLMREERGHLQKDEILNAKESNYRLILHEENRPQKPNETSKR